MNEHLDAFAKRKEQLKSLRQLGRPVAEKTKTCHVCDAVMEKKKLMNNFYVCPHCGHYMPLGAKRRIRLTVDKDSFKELGSGIVSKDPLDFPGYPEKLHACTEKTGLNDAILTGIGKIDGINVAIGVLDSRFLMGSMGVVVGDKVTRLVEYASKRKLPLILFSASGGARMQEGILSLMQMAKTSAAIERYSRNGGLFISVMTNPTTGGVTASFASLGDIMLAEPGALIGFAGPRVIEQTIGEKLPEGFQRAEYQLEHGFLDAIVERRDMKDTLSQLLKLHGYESSTMAAAKALSEAISEKAKVPESISGRFSDLSDSVSEKFNDLSDSVSEKFNDLSDSVSERFGDLSDSVSEKISGISETISEKFGTDDAPLSAAQKVAIARNADRPGVVDFIDNLFENFFEQRGDRFCYEDGSILGGIATYHGKPVTVIGHRKGKNLDERLQYRFGMPTPEGYRKAMRLMTQAEKYGRPIITFVDTPGAYPGLEAEARGQGEAIARSLALMSHLKVPVIAVITGEGGSGGALALAVGNSVVMLENAVYSVLSPEGFASILWKDSSRSSEACDVMKLTADDLHDLGVVDEVIPEPAGGAHTNPKALYKTVNSVISKHLAQYDGMSGTALASARCKKFYAMGTPYLSNIDSEDNN